MKYKYILFDADDTLLDFGLDENNAFKAVCTEKGLTYTPYFYERYSAINLGLWKQYERGEIEKSDITRLRYTKLLKEFGIDGDGVEFNECYCRNLSEGGITVKNAVNVCQKLKNAGYELYIVTNGIEFIQMKRLKKSGLDAYFKHVFISEKLGFQKPRKEYFDIVFKEIGCPDKEKYLIVGDSLTSDIKGGKNAGIDTCWINRKNVRNNGEVIPDYTVEEITQLLSILL